MAAEGHLMKEFSRPLTRPVNDPVYIQPPTPANWIIPDPMVFRRVKRFTR